MAYAYNEYTGTTDTDYLISFSGVAPGYLSEDHVHFYLNGIKQSDTLRTFIDSTHIRIAAPATTDIVRFQRESSVETALVDWTSGANVSAYNLDLNTLQMLYVAQEAADVGEIDQSEVTVLVALAAASAALAEDWAEEVEDTEVTTGKYSALHWAAKAAAEVVLAAEQVTLATVQTALATAQAALATAAKDDAVIAQGFAEAAQTGAETARTGAELAAAAALVSETNAAISETNATASETNAATSETNAETSETNAAASAAAALVSENNAETAETNAAASEAIALAAANYDGTWTATSYTVPSSVSYLGAIWVLNANAVSTDIPGTSTKWDFFKLTEYEIPVNPTLDLDFEKQVYKSYSGSGGLTLFNLLDRSTFTRATTKTYFDAMGVMQTAAAGDVVIDYDPATGECLGVSIESQRTNLLTYSEDFSNAAWTKIQASIGGAAVVVPDGSSVVCKLIEDTTATNQHFVRGSQTYTPGSTMNYSAYLKAGERTNARILLQTSTDGFVRVEFSLELGTVLTSATSGNASGLKYSIADVGNGWYRCSVSAIPGTSATTLYYDIILMNDTPTTAYTGDGTSGLYVWGAQLEAASFQSSYIPTTTAAVTRTADLLSMEGTDFSEWYRQSEGTIVAEFAAKADINQRIYAISNGTGTERIIGVFTNSGGAGVYTVVTDGGITQASVPITIFPESDTFYKLAGAYKLDDFAASRDGGVVATDSSGTIPTVDRLYIGANEAGTGSFLNGTIRRLTYWPRRLTNTQLQNLSRS